MGTRWGSPEERVSGNRYSWSGRGLSQRGRGRGEGVKSEASKQKNIKIWSQTEWLLPQPRHFLALLTWATYYSTFLSLQSSPEAAQPYLAGLLDFFLIIINHKVLRMMFVPVGLFNISQNKD